MTPRPFAEVADEAVGLGTDILAALGEGKHRRLASKCFETQSLVDDRDRIRAENLTLKGKLARAERAAQSALVRDTFDLKKQLADTEIIFNTAKQHEQRVLRQFESLQREKETLQTDGDEVKLALEEAARQAATEATKVEREFVNRDRQHAVDMEEWQCKFDTQQIYSEMDTKEIARLARRLKHAREKHEETVVELGELLEQSATTDQANARLRQRLSRLRQNFNGEAGPGPCSMSTEKTGAGLAPSTIADLFAYLQRKSQKHADFWSRVSLVCTSCAVSADMAPILLGNYFKLLGVSIDLRSIPSPTFFLRTETAYAASLRAAKETPCVEHREEGRKIFCRIFDGSPFGRTNIQGANLQCVGVRGKKKLTQLDAHDLADGTAEL